MRLGAGFPWWWWSFFKRGRRELIQNDFYTLSTQNANGGKVKESPEPPDSFMLEVLS